MPPDVRREVGAPGEFDALSDDELLAAPRERLAKLGLTSDAGSGTRQRSSPHATPRMNSNQLVQVLDGQGGVKRRALVNVTYNRPC